MRIILLSHNPKPLSSLRLIEAAQESGHEVRKLDDIPDLIKMVGGTSLAIKPLEGTQGIGVALAETRKAAESVIESFPGLQISGSRHRDTEAWLGYGYA